MRAIGFLNQTGVPPFGHSTQLRVFVDPDLLQYDEVWAAVGVVTDLKRG
jgi:prolyl-tRNA editing enzyme YbaK/EbsC (Cys-tRNA(Pro) deacylase)